ncbi:MAG: sulfatase-like hydrolase/transferase [Verrucomicrobiales bacterium]|nr:sulfatase-like hydrolase/transferase [Verrucomicrobiales bacterium]
MSSGSMAAMINGNDGVKAEGSMSPQRMLKLVALTVLGTLVGWYASAILAFAGNTYAFNNRFTEVAVQSYWWYLLWNNIVVLKGYALVGVGFTLVIYPLVRLWFGWRPFDRWGVIWRTLLFSGILYGFFTLRLMMGKPYFGDYGYLMGWYDALGTAMGVGVQQVVRDLLLKWLPLSMGLGALLYYLSKLRHSLRSRTGAYFTSVILIAVSLAAVSATGWALTRRTESTRKIDGSKGPRNIVILASDSLRADHLTCNGYSRQTSPRIDELARRGVNFGRCLTPIASTLESMTTLCSSQYPHTHGVHHMFPNRQMVEKVNREAPSMIQPARAKGYDTMATGDWCACGFNEMPMGFEDVVVSDFDNFRVYMSEVVYLHHQILPLFFDNEFGHALFPKLRSFANYMTPDVVTDGVNERLRQRAQDGRPFIILAFYSATHLPYKTPLPYSKLWTDPNYSGPHRHELALNVDEFIGSTDIQEKWRRFPAAEVAQVTGLYDGCVRLFDDCVGRVVDTLEETGLIDDTVVLITADHGDDLFEPGVTFGHGLTFNGGDQANHVPAVFYVPGAAAAGTRCDDVCRTIDFAPTLLDLVGLKAPAGFEGTSLAPVIRGETQHLDLAYYGETSYLFFKRTIEGEEPLHIPPMDETTFIDESFDFHFVLKPEYAKAVLDTKELTVRTQRFKLVRTPGVKGPIERLFDLTNDPHCERNVVARFPDVARRLREALRMWRDKGTQMRPSEIFDGKDESAIGGTAPLKPEPADRTANSEVK